MVLQAHSYGDSRGNKYISPLKLCARRQYPEANRARRSSPIGPSTLDRKAGQGPIRVIWRSTDIVCAGFGRPIVAVLGLTPAPFTDLDSPMGRRNAVFDRYGREARSARRGPKHDW
jgi:hypothetical protein